MTTSISDIALPEPDVAARPPALKRWLAGYHRVASTNGNEYHIFVNGSRPIFSTENDSKVDLDVEIPIGPLILQLRGYIDHIWNDVDIEGYVKVPLLPQIPVGELRGRLTDAIETRPDVPEIMEGFLRLFVSRDRWFTLGFDITIFRGAVYEGTLPVIPLPGATR
ncbi:hypothetical protein BD310DRAFT_926825 [Dichomitus squalens]|uniref:Uncharacterized protein n=1 Tax=Dichomitus squalens TaxID=114155 RepID=A0A4Q9PVP6_9APHY|nr:hypothetical protein BD310DRAFT_926825 [Dichomitus squalens]